MGEALFCHFLTDKEMEPEEEKLVKFPDVTSESGQKQLTFFLLSLPWDKT